MKKILAGLMVAVLLLLGVVTPLMAATAQNVAVTAKPSYIDIANTPATWILNGIKGDGSISPDSFYYAIGAAKASDQTAPGVTVADADCRFTITDTSSVNITLKVTMEDFAGGDADMTNSGDGTNGATAYGSYSYYSGLTYTSKVIVKEIADIATTGALYTSTSAGGADILWGLQIETQTDDWLGGDTSTSQLTITAIKA